jgi:hypothetical protein
MYSVVYFPNTDDVDVVATKWISNYNDSEEKFCYWPQTAKPSMVTKAVKMCTTPAKDWSTHLCRVYFQSG